MWFDNTPFEQLEVGEEKAMLGNTYKSIVQAPPIPTAKEIANALFCNEAISKFDVTKKELLNVGKYTIPTKYQASKEDWYSKAEWRSMWRFEKNFEENYPVQWEGFESNTASLRDMGWAITLEFNRATSRRKLCFRNHASGLMTRVPFEFNQPYIQIDKLYAVRNYKIKAAKFTETIAELTEDSIPEILEWIREIKRSKVTDFICSQNKKATADKIIDLRQYLKKRLAKAA